MSDPTARRGDNVMGLLKTMKQSRRGWPKGEMLDYLFISYRAGVTEQTLERIFNQLKDRGLIYAKTIKKHSPVLRWYVNEHKLAKLTGATLT